ncbi:MAG: glutamine-hydrolyzing carbamoyl-phosphate synthase small subunit [Chloroflexi bacterium]|nr:glutamine-hydrolyzing carbamoyl-phosphate synthase small subunit [Chloroflexota bacterium]
MAREAALVLEDGSAYLGQSFGAEREIEAEVVFNTSMTGYQEVCTDPSYRGQMVAMTHPQIGNYGVSPAAAESTRPWVEALIVRDLAPVYHHWEATGGLHEYLARWGVPGLEGVDTRALTRRLRRTGSLRGVLRLAGRHGFLPGDLEPYVREARAMPSLSERDVISEVSGAGQGLPDSGGTGRWPVQTAPEAGPSRARIVIVDCGLKHNIARSLARRGVEVVVLPWQAGAEAILAQRPDGVVVSNGPGDPARLDGLVADVQRLLESGVPLMGICLGHQVLGRAIGATTSRLPYGHHGGNHPVKDLDSGRVYITTQNHEFRVDAASIPPDSGFRVSHLNLNDGSVEGLAHRELPVFSVQFHPEGYPGPQDNQPLFDQFLELVSAHTTGGV